MVVFVKIQRNLLFISKSCSNYLNEDTCGSVDNFKYCKEPKPTFLLRSLGDELKVWVVSNRCEGGFKKFERVGNDKDEMYLYEEKMVYHLTFIITVTLHNEESKVVINNKAGISQNIPVIKILNPNLEE